MTPSDSVAQHIAKIENMARQLKDVSEELSEVMIMAKILGTLPQKFGPLITAWDSVSEANQIRDNLIEHLLTEENRLINFEEATSALATVKNRGKGGAILDANNPKNEASGTKNMKHTRRKSSVAIVTKGVI